MLTPLTEQPLARYGLSWNGSHNEERGADAWQARHHDHQYTLVDLGYTVLALFTNMRTGKEIGHQFVNLPSAMFAASQHAQVRGF